MWRTLLHWDSWMTLTDGTTFTLYHPPWQFKIYQKVWKDCYLQFDAVSKLLGDNTNDKHPIPFFPFDRWHYGGQFYSTLSILAKPNLHISYCSFKANIHWSSLLYSSLQTISLVDRREIILHGYVNLYFIYILLFLSHFFMPSLSFPIFP